MSSKEEISYPILKAHDVDYVLIVFGGLIGFSGDDINKFLWMIRISEGIWPEEVSEASFFNRGSYSIDENATPAMKNSLMYKMRYDSRCNSLLADCGIAIIALLSFMEADKPWIEFDNRSCPLLVQSWTL